MRPNEEIGETKCPACDTIYRPMCPKCGTYTVRELPAPRVKRIEWGPDDDVEIIGWMNSHNFNISWWTNHERGWHFSLGVLDKRGGPFETKDTAKVACQSAFDAWVKSMMEGI